MNQTKRIIEVGSLVALGLFAGAMLLIAVAIVPHWNGLSPEGYRTSFQALGPRLGSAMVPLMLFAILLSAVATFPQPESRRLRIVVFGLVFVIVPLYLSFSAPINEALLGTIPLSESSLNQLRERWCFWHAVRLSLGLGAFTLALFDRVRN